MAMMTSTVITIGIITSLARQSRLWLLRAAATTMMPTHSILRDALLGLRRVMAVRSHWQRYILRTKP